MFEKESSSAPSVFDRVRNIPGLADIFKNDTSNTILSLPDEDGFFHSQGHTYDDSPRMRILVGMANKIRSSLGEVSNHQTRLWRGNRPNEAGSNPSYTNSLEGIALPFLLSYGGYLTYIDIPNDRMSEFLVTAGAAEGAEYILPSDLMKSVRIVGVPDDETQEIISKSQLPDDDASGWQAI